MRRVLLALALATAACGGTTNTDQPDAFVQPPQPDANVQPTPDAAPDTTPPSVVSVDPADLATSVDPGTAITWTFDEAIMAGTANVSVEDQNSNPVTGTLAYDTNTVTFLPDAPLAGGLQYTAVILGVQDLAGNAMPGMFDSSFTTAGDSTPPTVLSVDPTDGATGVDPKATITWTFDEPIMAGSAMVKVEDPSGNLVSGTLAYDTMTVTFIPDAPLTGSTTYTIAITGVTDLAGNSMTVAVASTFTTVDTTPPTVTGTFPTDGATNVNTFDLTVDFSEPVTQSSLAVTVVDQNGSLVATVISLDASGKEATVVPSAGGTFPSDSVFTVTVSGSVTDLAGNPMGTDYVFSFASPDTIAPTLANTSPLMGSVNNTNVTFVDASYSEDVAGGTITVIDANGNEITGTTADSGPDVIFTPDAALPDGVYTVTVSGVTDLAGNGAATDGWSFAVGAPSVISSYATPTFTFPQNGDTTDADGSFFPGQANNFDIFADFSLGDGGDDQFDRAMYFIAGPAIGGIPFPAQTAANVTFSTPLLGVNDGVEVAAVSDGSFIGPNNHTDAAITAHSAFLNDIADARLQQIVDLTNADASTAITMSWNDNAFICGGTYEIPISGAYYRVEIYNLAGDLLLDASNTATTITNTADLTDFAGQQIIISFEQYGEGEGGDFAPSCLSSIDNVSIVDSVDTEFVQNGDFENGAASWQTNSPLVSQNITSSPESLSDGLTVTRSFFTAPNLPWGRWVDVIENDTSSDITEDFHLYSRLGGDGCDVLYEVDGSPRALGGWDLTGDDRDVGLVFGGGATLQFASATSLGAPNCGDPNQSNVYADWTSITVPAGGKIAIVSFVILNGDVTGTTTTDPTAHADNIDAVANAILDGFWTDATYRWGMTDDQIAHIINF